jgi:hypothetical protein
MLTALSCFFCRVVRVFAADLVVALVAPFPLPTAFFGTAVCSSASSTLATIVAFDWVARAAPLPREVVVLEGSGNGSTSSSISMESRSTSLAALPLVALLVGADFEPSSLLFTAAVFAVAVARRFVGRCSGSGFSSPSSSSSDLTISSSSIFAFAAFLVAAFLVPAAARLALAVGAWVAFGPATTGAGSGSTGAPLLRPARVFGESSLVVVALVLAALAVVVLAVVALVAVALAAVALAVATLGAVFFTAAGMAAVPLALGAGSG